MSDTPGPVEIDPHDRPLLERIGRLRVQAWSAFLPDAEARTACWLDDFELVARHWCVFHDGEPVAAARLSIHDRLDDVPDAEVYRAAIPPPPPIPSFNRLVVHPGHRGRGLPPLLDEARIRAAELAGCRSGLGETTSSPHRREQLRQAGFREVGAAAPYKPGHFFTKQGVVVVIDLPRPRKPTA